MINTALVLELFSFRVRKGVWYFFFIVCVSSSVISHCVINNTINDTINTSRFILNSPLIFNVRKDKIF